MTEFKVKIERHGYDPRIEVYRIFENGSLSGKGASIDAAIEALRTFRAHGHTYPGDAHLTIEVEAASDD